MSRFPIFLILVLLFIACTNKKELAQAKSEIQNLKKENDSLKSIVDDINSKYVFDSISFRNIYAEDNKYQRNADFEMELLVVGYNPNKSYFVKYDSIVNGQKINPDTLDQRNGGFKYNTKLKDKENEIWIEMNVKNQYGKRKQAVLYDLIRTKY